MLYIPHRAVRGWIRPSTDRAKLDSPRKPRESVKKKNFFADMSAKRAPALNVDENIVFFLPLKPPRIGEEIMLRFANIFTFIAVGLFYFSGFCLQ